MCFQHEQHFCCYHLKTDVHFFVMEYNLCFPNQDHCKQLHYQSKGNWSDNFNNYGKFKCKGSLLINESGKRSDKELVLCELEDVNGEYMWNIPKRSDSEWEAGVGKSTIVSATKKYEKLIGKTCVYAVSYYKDTFHTKTKCKN